MGIRFLLFIFIYSLISCVAFSQEEDEYTDDELKDLKGKHSIFINLGVIDQTSKVTIDPLNVSNKMNFQASLAYNYWMKNELAFEANVGFINSSVNNNVTSFGVEQKTAVITNFFLGIKYSPAFKNVPYSFRPFTRLLTGVVIGSATEEKVAIGLLKTNSITQTALSAKLGVGADIIVDRYLRFGLAVDYLIMPDFNESVGTRKNYSGVNFSFIIGAIF